MQKEYDYKFRGLEFHATRMWESAQVINALDFMQKNHMNTLIFHMNELLDVLVLPEKLYTQEQMWAYWPVRNDHSIFNREYLKWVIMQCKKRNINFMIEVKEIWYFDSLIEAHPELGLTDEHGHVCATNPFWPEYMEMRVEELLTKVPDLGGIIVSLGTRESKVSLAANRCTCDRCKNVDPKEWYKSIITAMYKPLQKRGKQLVVRDFSYSPEHLNAVVDACAECSKDIVVSLKNTPHDFYPLWPNNARIGNIGSDAPEYIEFDIWGQFYGMNLFPSGLDEDLQYRLRYDKEKGAVGAYFRDDLETTRESSCYNGLNMVNRYAAAMLTQDVNTPIDDIYKAWVKDGITSPLIPGSFQQVPCVPTAPDAWRRFRDFMHACWQVMIKTQYIRGQLFLVNGKIPSSIFEAFGMLITIQGRCDWEPGIEKLLDRTEENIAAIIKEKDEALVDVKKLEAILDIDTLGITPELAADIREVLDLYYYYVLMIRSAAIVFFRGQKAIETKTEEDLEKAKAALADFADVKKVIVKRMENTDYPHYVYHHFIPDRFDMLANDIQEKLGI